MLNKHFLILGASSKTGHSLIQFMEKYKLIYSISDNKPNFFQILQLKNPPIYVYDSLKQDINQLTDIEHIIIAPGFPRSHPLLQEAKRQNIPIDSDIAFTYHLLKFNNKLPYLIGITGSNGKSTTCYLLYKILESGYKKGQVFLLGNFGTPIISYFDKIQSQDIVILELSSYQLEDAEKYHINFSCILNITPNHLDRYPSFKEYELTKEKIFLNQTKQDMTSINKNLSNAKRLESIANTNIIFVDDSSKEFPDSENITVSHNNEWIIYKNQPFIKISELLLQQSHMISNFLHVIAITQYLKIDSEIIKNQLRIFKGLEHRAEFVLMINNIKFINDSKATTPIAIIPNLHSFDNIVLILGGQNKNLDFSILNTALKNVKYIVFYGQSGLDIQKQVDFQLSKYIYDFKQATVHAFKIACEMSCNTILLSTGCTSFDQFSSYKERGKYFKEIAYEIQKEYQSS